MYTLTLNPHANDSLSEALLITDDRRKELGDLAMHYLINTVDTAEALNKMAADCRNANELVFAMYMIGYNLGRMDIDGETILPETN